MSITVEYFGDCRDEASFGKPWTDAEIDRIRVLQSMRLKYQGEKLPMHPATYADGRWLSTLDATREALRGATERAEALEKALGEVRPHLIARTLSPTPHPWEVRDELAKAECAAKIDALLAARAERNGGGE